MVPSPEISTSTGRSRRLPAKFGRSVRPGTTLQTISEAVGRGRLSIRDRSDNLPCLPFATAGSSSVMGDQAPFYSARIK